MNSFECLRSELKNLNDLFKETDVCKFVGLISFKYLTQKLDLRESSTPFINFLSQRMNMDDDNCVYFKAFNKIDNNKVVVRGGMSAMLVNLLTMSTPPSRKFTYDQILDAVELRVNKIKLPYLGQISNARLDYVRSSPDSYSGFIPALLSGMTRRESFSFCYEVASKLINKLQYECCYGLCLWVYGTRPKQARLKFEFDELKARPIALCDSVTNLVCSCISQYIFGHYKKIPRSELFLGRTLSVGDFQYLEDNFAGRKGCIYFSPD